MEKKDGNIFRRLFRRYSEMVKKDFLEETGAENEAAFRKERLRMDLRNLCVIIAAILFVLSLLIHSVHEDLRGVGYLFGAGAYFCELLMLTKGFREPLPRREAFMANCFGPLYVLMGIAYLLE